MQVEADTAPRRHVEVGRKVSCVKVLWVSPRRWASECSVMLSGERASVYMDAFPPLAVSSKPTLVRLRPLWPLTALSPSCMPPRPLSLDQEPVTPRQMWGPKSQTAKLSTYVRWQRTHVERELCATFDRGQIGISPPNSGHCASSSPAWSFGDQVVRLSLSSINRQIIIKNGTLSRRGGRDGVR